MQVPAGHTYHLQIAVSGFLDERGMTYDFGDIKAIYKNYLEPHLDHRYLNETLPYMNTTAENMVYWIFQTMSQELSDDAVSVWNMFVSMKLRLHLRSLDGSG